jgi:hypothetical protein
LRRFGGSGILNVVVLSAVRLCIERPWIRVSVALNSPAFLRFFPIGSIENRQEKPVRQKPGA